MSSFGYDLLGFGSSANTAVDLPSDDEFNRVSFLSHFDGANNGVNNAFDDGSSSNHTITATANVTQGSFGPFARPEGYWGMSFDGANDYLTVPDSDDFNIASGLFTAETWIFPTASSSQPIIMGQWSGSYSWVLLLSNDSNRYPRFIIYDGAFSDNASSTSIPLNQWSHLALVRESGNVFKMYLNGVQVYSVTLNKTANNSSDPLSVGADDSGGSPFQGFLSNTRFVKGTAVYTSAFTPSTSPLTAVTNTKLLTCQSNRFVDNSASAHTITASGGAAVSAFGPFLTDAVYDPAVNGASAYFDGTTDNLSVGASADFQLGTGDLTVEFWSYNTDRLAANNFLDNRANANGFALQRNAQNKFNVYFEPSSTSVFTSGFVPQNAWIHFCWTRASGVNKFFIDGAQSGSNVSDASDFNSNSLTIGRNASGGQVVTGYMCDVRIIKGTAVEPSAIPTAPLTAITNTKLLLNMADGQAIDSAAQNNMTLYGNAKLSTTQAKFGDTSLALDGTGDYAIAANNTSFNFGTGDFTVEMFVYATAIGGGSENVILDTRAANSDAGLVIYSANGAVLSVTSSGAVRATAGTISTNQWIHVAVVRSSGTLTAYINGTGGTGASYSSAITSPGPFRIGVHENGGSTWQGFIDEYRVSNTARYTNNFTAPTAPFADKGQ